MKTKSLLASGMHMKSTLFIAKWLALAALTLFTLRSQLSTAHAQGTAFTYQGELNSNGSDATGIYDMKFAVYDAPTNGNAVAGPLTNTATTVNNGYFMVTMDFGSGVFTGPGRWLDIAVRTNGATSFTSLIPRQPLTASPYAIMAHSASNVLGTLPTAQLSGTVGNGQLANNAVTINAGTGLGGGGAVSLGGATTLNNAGVLSVTGNADITASTLNGAVTLGDTATTANTANTIVKRDNGGNFSAGSVTLGGNLYLPGSGASTGMIYSGSSTIISGYGPYNFFAGYNAGNTTMTGGSNTATGAEVLSANTTGSNNTANGFAALYLNTTGSDNTATGAVALWQNSSGSDNTANGYNALYWNQSGSYNTGYGQQALALNSVGSNNIAVGYQAGYNIQSNNNIDIGNQGVSSDNGIIRIGTVGTHTNTYLAGVINGNGGGLTNLNAATLSGTLPLAQLAGAVLTNNESGPVTFNGGLSAGGSVTLGGNLYLPGSGASAGMIYSGSSTIISGYGPFNFFAGYNAGNTTMTGGSNTANGVGALSANTTGSNNTANGTLALWQNSSGSDNTANGNNALFWNQSGSYNTGYGQQALALNSTGSNNIAVGYQAGYNVFNNNNIDIGNQGVSSDNGIIRIGTAGTHTNTYLAGVINGNGAGLTNLQALGLGISANNNFFAGSGAGNGTMSGSDNTGIGVQALCYNTIGSNNTANGSWALFDNSSGTWNTANGAYALSLNTTGGSNTATGTLALYNNTTGIGNTANGAGALYENTGSYNTATGDEALFLNTTGWFNTANGVEALYLNTTGSDNTATGGEALSSNTTGSNNTANGVQALYENTSGSDNTANGYNALFWNQSGSYNTGYGQQALVLNSTGSNNIAVGYQAGYNIQSNNNIDIGNQGVSSDNGAIRIGTAGSQASAFIAGIYSAGSGNGIPVFINSSGQLGTVSPGNLAFGYQTSANAQYATVSGGAQNVASGGGAVVAGGGYDGNNIIANTASGPGASILGGTQNIASGSRSSVGGGHNNSATNWYATVPGGAWNIAGGTGSFAAGQAAQALHDGSFVWSDASTPNVLSTNTNSVTMRASGGYRLFSNPGMSAGVSLAAGSGSWTSMSDRNSKENFVPVDSQSVLAKVAALPLSSWNYRSQDKSIRHIGPMAQDFKAAFAVGETETGICTVDADGVALAAIQGLNQKLNEKDAEIQELKRSVNELKNTVRLLAKKK